MVDGWYNALGFQASTLNIDDPPSHRSNSDKFPTCYIDNSSQNVRHASAEGTGGAECAEAGADGAECVEAGTKPIPLCNRNPICVARQLSIRDMESVGFRV